MLAFPSGIFGGVGGEPLPIILALKWKRVAAGTRFDDISLAVVQNEIRKIEFNRGY